MRFIVPLVRRYLNQTDRRSRASVLYEEAHLHGTAWDRRREKLRRAIREILAFYIFSVLVLIVWIGMGMPSESDAVIPALEFSVVVGPACWLIYKIVRFVLAK